MKQKVLLLLQGVDQKLIGQAAQLLTDWTFRKTYGKFSLEFDFQTVSAPLSVLTGTVIEGVNNEPKIYKYIDPYSIARNVPNPNAPIVGFLYWNPTLYADTISVELPVIQNGVTFFALPISPQANIQGIAENILHELGHAWYFLVNLTGANLTDDVHQHAGLDDPRPEANLSDVLLKLEPYWPILSMPSVTSILKSTIIRLQARVNQLKQLIQERLRK